MKPPVEAEIVASLLAADHARFGGVHVRCPADTTRDAWLASLRAALPPGTPWIRVPANASAQALLGGLDLAATLAAGRPVASRGLMARAHGGFLLLTMADRAAPLVLASLQQVMDEGQVHVERDGACARASASFGLIVLDEGREEDSTLPAGLLDRLAFTLDEAALECWRQEGLSLSVAEVDALETLSAEATAGSFPGDADTAGAPFGAAVEAVMDLPATAAEEEAAVRALCGGAWQLGILSLRAPILALAVARACAQAAGRSVPAQEDLVGAARLVYSARARQRPATADESPADPAPAPPPEDGPPKSAQAEVPATEPDASAAQLSAAESARDDTAEKDVTPPSRAEETPDAQEIAASVVNDLPPDLLARLASDLARQGSGRVVAQRRRKGLTPRHGRPIGSRPGDPRHGMPLDLLATLRAALPWQHLRTAAPVGGARLAIRAGDLQVRQLKPRTRSTAVFAVDASGSAALNRLNEAKGAVEALLSQCYVRRDQVALISFRGAVAEVLLPPTRSLARLRRELSALPGGGGTPLASGLELAHQLGGELRRRGDAPLLVVLTDGRANVSRDGIGGRARAEQEAFAAAVAIGQQRLPALLVDIAPQPQERARLLAQAMGAEYLPLPAASAERLAAAVQARLPSAQGARHA